MQSKRRIEAILEHGKLDSDEKLILQELLRQGYAANGLPIGKPSAIPMRELAALLPGTAPAEDEDAGATEASGGKKKRRKTRSEEACERHLRKVVENMVRRRIPIICHPGPGGGYYLPAKPEEVEANRERFRKRALTGFMKGFRAAEGSFVDFVVQLTMDFDGPEGDALRQRMGAPPRDTKAVPAMFGIVTSFLRRVKDDPQQYAEYLHQLQDEFGPILVPQYKVREVREGLARVQRLLGELA